MATVSGSSSDPKEFSGNAACNLFLDSSFQASYVRVVFNFVDGKTFEGYFTPLRQKKDNTADKVLLTLESSNCESTGVEQSIIRFEIYPDQKDASSLSTGQKRSHLLIHTRLPSTRSISAI